MVKRAGALGLLVCLLCMGRALGAGLPRVVDDADLFTPREEAAIERQVRALIEAYQMDVAVVTSYAPRYGASQQFADDYYDDHGYGLGEDQAGLLYLIDMRNRTPTISTKGAMIDYLTDRRLEELFDCSYDALAAGDYGASTLQLLERLGELLRQGREEGSFRYDSATGERLTGGYNALTRGELLFALLAGALTSGGIVWFVTGRYRLRRGTYSYDWRSRAAAQVDDDLQVFVRSTVVHRPKPPPPTHGPHGPGGFGGDRGSGVHVSRGGIHGGGSGRRF